MTANTAAANTAPAGKVWRECGKCRGTGHLPEYGHVAAGTCFACNGEGRYLAPADWRQREARAEKRRQREAAKRAASGANARLWAEFTAAHPAEAALIEQHKNGALGYAWSSVYVHDERDCNPAQALHMARQYAAANSITL